MLMREMIQIPMTVAVMTGTTKILTVILAGVMVAGMSAGSVQAATTEDASGDLYVFIAASLANAMDEIQKDFNEEYPDVNILFNADSSGTLQTQIEEGSRCDIFFSAATKQMDALVDEELAKKDSVVDLLENKVVLIKPKVAKQKLQVSKISQMRRTLRLRARMYRLDSIPVKSSKTLASKTMLTRWRSMKARM